MEIRSRYIKVLILVAQTLSALAGDHYLLRVVNNTSRQISIDTVTSVKGLDYNMPNKISIKPRENTTEQVRVGAQSTVQLIKISNEVEACTSDSITLPYEIPIVHESDQAQQLQITISPIHGKKWSCKIQITSTHQAL